MNIDLPARVFLLRVEARSEQSEIELDQQSTGSINSSGSHPAVRLTLQSRDQEFVKMLSEATDEQDIASIMLHPVVTRKRQNLEGPVDITATTTLLRDSLQLAHEARQYVNAKVTDTTLDETQTNEAFAWLQHEVFEDKFMCNEILKQRILAFDTCSDALSRE